MCVYIYIYVCVCVSLANQSVLAAFNLLTGFQSHALVTAHGLDRINDKD